MHIGRRNKLSVLNHAPSSRELLDFLREAGSHTVLQAFKRRHILRRVGNRTEPRIRKMDHKRLHTRKVPLKRKTTLRQACSLYS